MGIQIVTDETIMHPHIKQQTELFDLGEGRWRTGPTEVRQLQAVITNEMRGAVVDLLALFGLGASQVEKFFSDPILQTGPATLVVQMASTPFCQKIPAGNITGTDKTFAWEVTAFEGQ